MSQYSHENTSVNNAKACNFIKKILQHRFFPVNIAEFIRTALCIEQLCWLLLDCIGENLRQLPHLEIRLNAFRRSTSPQNNSLCVVRCAVWYHLYTLKNVKNTHGWVILLIKLQAHIILILNWQKPHIILILNWQKLLAPEK